MSEVKEKLIKTVVTSDIKKFHVNWTESPKNCRTMNKLLRGCLTKTKQCQIYRLLLAECHRL